MKEAMSELSTERKKALGAMADRLRRHSLTSTTKAGSGHPTSCMSCAELVSVLFFQFLRFDLQNPKSPYNDRFVLSKGHAAPILWAVLAEAGAFPVEKVNTLRQIDSELEGHPTPRCPFVDVATGSLGQGLSAGAGMARASRMDELNNRVYVLLGDGETAEGAVWEAVAIASHYKLDNLIAIIDVNRLGQSEETMYGHDVRSYERRFSAFTSDDHGTGIAHQLIGFFFAGNSEPAHLFVNLFAAAGWIVRSVVPGDRQGRPAGRRGNLPVNTLPAWKRDAVGSGAFGCRSDDFPVVFVFPQFPKLQCKKGKDGGVGAEDPESAIRVLPPKGIHHSVRVILPPRERPQPQVPFQPFGNLVCTPGRLLPVGTAAIEPDMHFLDLADGAFFNEFNGAAEGSGSGTGRGPVVAKVFFAPVPEPDSQYLRHLIPFFRSQLFVEGFGLFALAAAGAIVMRVPIASRDPDAPAGLFDQRRAR